MSEDAKRVQARLLLAVFYESLWGRLSGFCYGVRRDGTLRWDIPLDPAGWRRVLGALGDYCDRREAAWREKWVRAGRRPPAIWKRRSPPDML